MVPCELFFSGGGEFTEEQKFIEIGQIKGDRFEVSFPVEASGNRLRYRFDPGNHPIIIRDLEIKVTYCDGGSGMVVPVRIGNVAEQDGALIFPSDPWVEIQLDRCPAELHASFNVVARGASVITYVGEMLGSLRYVQEENAALHEESRRLWGVIRQKDELLEDLR
jgi:hypothetical protein